MTFMSRTFVGKTFENYKLLNSNPEIKKPENSFMRAKTAVDTLANATLITYYAKKTRKYLKMDIPGMKRCSIRGMRTYDILDMKKYKRLFGAAEYHAYFIYGSGNLEKSINGQELVVEAYEKFINQLKSNEYGRCEALTQNGKSIIINYKERVETARKAQAKAYSTIVAWIDREITNIKYENPDKVPYLVGLKAEALGKKQRRLKPIHGQHWRNRQCANTRNS